MRRLSTILKKTRNVNLEGPSRRRIRRSERLPHSRIRKKGSEMVQRGEGSSRSHALFVRFVSFSRVAHCSVVFISSPNLAILAYLFTTHHQSNTFRERLACSNFETSPSFIPHLCFLSLAQLPYFSPLPPTLHFVILTSKHQSSLLLTSFPQLIKLDF